MAPERTQPRVLGAKRGASSPSLISRVTAKRLKLLGKRKMHVLSPWGQCELAVSMSPSAADTMPSPFVSTRAMAALYPLVVFQKWRWTDIAVTLGLIFVVS